MKKIVSIITLIFILGLMACCLIGCVMEENPYYSSENSSRNSTNGGIPQGARFIRHDTNVGWAEIWEHEETGVCYFYDDDRFIVMLKPDGSPYIWRD